MPHKKGKCTEVCEIKYRSVFVFYFYYFTANRLKQFKYSVIKNPLKYYAKLSLNIKGFFLSQESTENSDIYVLKKEWKNKRTFIKFESYKYRNKHYIDIIFYVSVLLNWKRIKKIHIRRHRRHFNDIFSFQIIKHGLSKLKRIDQYIWHSLEFFRIWYYLNFGSLFYVSKFIGYWRMFLEI